jgi:CRP/FNR family transcriptional regulator, cyclic AMP receptor protein
MAPPARSRPNADAEPADPLAALLASAPSIGALAARGEVRRYRKGMLLIQEGDQGDTIYIVLEGKLRAFSEADNGRAITYGTYGVGEFVGEMSLDGGPRSASIETLETTICAVITRTTLEHHITEQPAFAFELLAKVIRRARAATVSAKQLALNDVYGRLKLLLESSATLQADGTLWIAERLTHQQMAHFLGCSREMISRVMKDLQAGGHAVVIGKGLLINGRLPMRW